MTRLPSIGDRLIRTLVGWALLWSAVLAAAVWLSVRHEIGELLDSHLQAMSQALAAPLGGDAGGDGVVVPRDPAAIAEAGTGPGAAVAPYAWQLVAHDNGSSRVLMASASAPPAPMRATPSPGITDGGGWRVHGMPVGAGGRMLYVGQSDDERIEVQLEIGLAVLLAGLPMALLGLIWLRARAQHELRPLQRLSARLEAMGVAATGGSVAVLGPAERRELVPVHEAIDTLAVRLARRIAHERAFTAHAAHALRTPLAGIDAQLAVALRDCPPALQHRLQRVRSGAGRLQHVVAALLALFRSDAEIRRAPVDLAALMAGVAVDGLAIELDATHTVVADADLLSATVVNLLDNALQHGAARVIVTTPAPDVLRVADDGSGADAALRQRLQQAIDGGHDDGGAGLGLMLAALVARAHGGSMSLPVVATGFAVELRLSTTTA